MEAIVRQARQNFGETLPTDFLSPEEYNIYERLYGPPLRATRPEDVRLLQDLEEEQFDGDELPANTLFKEDADGNLEEVAYNQERTETSLEGESSVTVGEGALDADGGDEFKARYTLFRDIAAAQEGEVHQEDGEEATSVEEDYVLNDAQEEVDEDESDYDDVDGEDGSYQIGDDLRTHPLTAAGRFRTSPATLQIPYRAVIGPVTSLLADASNKHLTEVAQKTFGGPALPNSTATVSLKSTPKQAPIALEASQSHMGEMEGNAFMAAIMPGAYVTVMSTLVEVRKRLGSEWIRELLAKKDGPLILDAGAGGAGVQAWREILRAEWELMQPDGMSPGKPAPFGKATVVTGSSVLRHRASRLLDDTTFLPRLPDYNPSKDHPSLAEKNAAQPRKQYDIIVAPNTLWTLKEDYMRKNQVQNLWSLLNPKGGVLIIIEKGVPHGFELVAGARETLLKYHIASPESLQVENHIQEPFEGRHRPKETGMIVAPCTNHFQCPMYLASGHSKARKDHCHFSQRFVRPPYLQRILGVKDRNHEDIKFSYVAVQRGIDHRKVHSIIQGQPATDIAFEGHGGDEFWGRHEQSESLPAASEAAKPEVEELASKTSGPETHPHTLSLPRSILPPMKRRGHVTLDLCTPAGRIERWTVPKSFGKQAYRDARKSSWGDLWALGAKTRTYRNIRLGTQSKKVRGKDAYELDAGADGMEDSIRHVKRPKGEFEKRTKRGRKERSKRKISEDDFLV